MRNISASSVWIELWREIGIYTSVHYILAGTWRKTRAKMVVSPLGLKGACGKGRRGDRRPGRETPAYCSGSFKAAHYRIHGSLGRIFQLRGLPKYPKTAGRDALPGLFDVLFSCRSKGPILELR